MSSESRIWEIRLFGSMRGGSALVIGLWPFNPTAPAYSTKRRRNSLFPLFPPVQILVRRRGRTGLRQEHQRRREHLRQPRRLSGRFRLPGPRHLPTPGKKALRQAGRRALHRQSRRVGTRRHQTRTPKAFASRLREGLASGLREYNSDKSRAGCVYVLNDEEIGLFSDEVVVNCAHCAP